MLFVSEKRRHLEYLWIIRARWGWRANYLAIKNFSYFSPRHRSLLCGFRDGGGNLPPGFVFAQQSCNFSSQDVHRLASFKISEYLHKFVQLFGGVKKRISSLPAYHCYICKRPLLPKKKYHGLIWRDNWQGGWVTRFGLWRGGRGKIGGKRKEKDNRQGQYEHPRVYKITLWGISILSLFL